MQKSTAAILGLFIFLGLGLFGYLLSTAALTVKGMERVVTVKGLARER